MSLPQDLLKQILAEADHPLGIMELLRLAGLHPGQQTELKRALRELVRQGDILKDGKRFVPRQPSRREADVRARAQGAPEAWRQRGAEGLREGGPNRGPRQAGQRAAGPGGFAGRRHEPGARGKRAGWQERGPGHDRRGALKHGGGFRQESPGRGGRISEADGDGLLEGILHVHRDGFGFVHPLSAEGDNVFLPPHEAQRALDNDRVVVAVSGRPPRLEGRLVRVVQRRRELAVGTYAVKGRYAVVYPTDSSLPGPIRVPLTQMAREGDLVKVQLGIGAQMLDPDRGLHGEVAGSLGKPGTPSAEVLGVAYAQGFSDEFPQEVMGEADRYAVTVSEEEARGEGRRDLRALPLITIDGEDARDFDDAVYVEDHADGWRLVVAIADVSHYVWEGSALNAEALRRATSVYLPDRVLPMLPERLSNGICSLRPDEDRLCMVADMSFDRRGHRRTYDLYPAVMRSVARCTYNEVQDVLDGQDVPHRNAFKPHFERLMSLARALMKMRKARGAIDFDLPEHKVVLDEDGVPARMDKRERKDSHRLIEECMLAANEAVATFFQDEGLPTVYRFHGEPDPEKLATFAALAGAYGFKMRVEDGVSSKELDAFVSQLHGHPEQRALNQLLLRSMMQAVYTASRVGHYGLAAEHYLHFTSPIRRYPDLLVHRLLKAHWARKGRAPSQSMLEREEDQLEDMSAQCSERERAAMQVEREVVSFYACLLMKDRVGEEFAATVAAITDFGFFVELDEEHVEGLVKAETMGPGAKLDKLTHSLVYANGRRVRVGQKLRVRLTSVNVTAKKMDFEALQFDGEAPLSRVATRGEPPRRRQAWTDDAPSHRERDRAGRPGRHEREAAAASRGAPPGHQGETGPGRPRGRFSREGRREEAAPHRKEPRFPPRAPEGQEPPRSESTEWSKRRTFIRPESQAPAPVAAETAGPLPPEAPSAPAPWELPTGDDAAQSPHPGFDRIRALASQRQRGPEARGAHHGRSFQKQKPHGGPGPRFPAPKPRLESEEGRAFSMEPPPPDAPVEALPPAVSRAEPEAPAPVAQESVRAEPVKAEPVKSVPVRAEPVKSEPVNEGAAPTRRATDKQAVVKATRTPAREKAAAPGNSKRAAAFGSAASGAVGSRAAVASSAKKGAAVVGAKQGAAVGSAKKGAAVASVKQGAAVGSAKKGAAVVGAKQGAAVGNAKKGAAVVGAKKGAAVVGAKKGTVVGTAAVASSGKKGAAVVGAKKGAVAGSAKKGAVVGSAKKGAAVSSAKKPAVASSAKKPTAKVKKAAPTRAAAKATQVAASKPKAPSKKSATPTVARAPKPAKASVPAKKKAPSERKKR